MAKGKQTCKILKEIRRQIAVENDIEFVTSECTYKGDCEGTCPKCEAEVRYLERELEKRQRLGKVAVFAGMSLGTLLTAAACDTTANVASNSSNGTEATRNDPSERETEGMVRMHTVVYDFDSAFYQTALKDKFRIRYMEDLTIVGGRIPYGYTTKENWICKNFEELIEDARDFNAPSFLGGEQKMREYLAAQLKEDASNYSGDVEVSFTVDVMGKLHEVAIVKGLEETLDADIVSVFEQMEWEAGWYRTKHHQGMNFECQCIKKIHFPITNE